MALRPEVSPARFSHQRLERTSGTGNLDPRVVAPWWRHRCDGILPSL